MKLFNDKIENFKAVMQSGFCDRSMANARSLVNVMPPGQFIICFSVPSLVFGFLEDDIATVDAENCERFIADVHVSPCQLQAYNCQAVSLLCNITQIYLLLNCAQTFSYVI